jgi:hypothetical protein
MENIKSKITQALRRSFLAKKKEDDKKTAAMLKSKKGKQEDADFMTMVFDSKPSQSPLSVSQERTRKRYKKGEQEDPDFMTMVFDRKPSQAPHETARDRRRRNCEDFMEMNFPKKTSAERN